MSIVHVDKIWVEIAKKFEMRTSGGGGGVISDFGHPRTRGGGGVKKGQIFADVLYHYGWPLSMLVKVQLTSLTRSATHTAILALVN